MELWLVQLVWYILADMEFFSVTTVSANRIETIVLIVCLILLVSSFCVWHVQLGYKESYPSMLFSNLGASTKK